MDFDEIKNRTDSKLVAQEVELAEVDISEDQLIKRSLSQLEELNRLNDESSTQLVSEGNEFTLSGSFDDEINL